MRRIGWTCVTVLSLGLVTGREASAQSAGFAVNHFEPSERGSEWFANESLDLRGHGRPAIGLVGDYQYRPLVTYDGNGDIRKSVVRNMLTLHAGASVVFWDRLRIAGSLPVVAFVDGHSDVLPGGRALASPKNEQALGDVRLAADVRVLGEHGDPLTLALGAQVWLPTGEKESYAGDGKWRLQPHALVAGDVGMLTYAARLGFDYRARQEDFGGAPIGNQIVFAAAAGIRTLEGGRLVVGPELFGTTVTDDAFGKRTTPLEGILGAHYGVTRDVRLGAGVGAGLTRGYGSPEFRALLGVDWMPAVATDRDGDGILDEDDRCPDVKGRPASPDNENGCPLVTPPPPEPAPLPPPPPPSDRDHDGILDDDDACPEEAGPRRDDPKTNGCPDRDRDKDTVLDKDDACPDEPGQPDPDPKRNGCPKAFVQSGQIKILDQVKFKTASSDIEGGKDSQDVLEAVLGVLKAHPEITKVRVEGHTDDRGSAAMNKKLSADRAASVVTWLSTHGIDKGRLTSKGFGPDKPIADNKTDEGRRQNRRVEFHIE